MLRVTDEMTDVFEGTEPSFFHEGEQVDSRPDVGSFLLAPKRVEGPAQHPVGRKLKPRDQQSGCCRFYRVPGGHIKI